MSAEEKLKLIEAIILNSYGYSTDNKGKEFYQGTIDAIYTVVIYESRTNNDKL